MRTDEDIQAYVQAMKEIIKQPVNQGVELCL
jgi:hypothetical protein